MSIVFLYTHTSRSQISLDERAPNVHFVTSSLEPEKRSPRSSMLGPRWKDSLWGKIYLECTSQQELAYIFWYFMFCACFAAVGLLSQEILPKHFLLTLWRCERARISRNLPPALLLCMSEYVWKKSIPGVQSWLRHAALDTNVDKRYYFISKMGLKLIGANN